MKPIIAIVGRPNAGKSTLFNRITRSKDALVDDFPGVTRDRHFRDATWDDKQFTMVDTGGFSTGDDDPFSQKIRFQIDQAISDADAVILLLDGKGGVSPFDAEMIGMLRGLDKPVFYAVNKIDAPEQEDRLHDFYALGLDDLHPLSAEHGYGISDFLDQVTAALPQITIDEDKELTRLAVVGRPNVGKSSLINRILGEDRHVVSDIPGTTRDAVDAVCRVEGRSYLLVDTAGIRRKGKVSLKLEKFSIIKSLRSLDRCHVALIVLDAEEGVTDQDIRVAGYAHDRGCGCIFVLNKWDLVERNDASLKRFKESLRMNAKFLAFAPIITTSALTGLRVRKIFKLVDEVQSQYCHRIGTGALNRIIEEAIHHNEPPMHKGRRLKFYYATQVSTKPPTFVCFVNYPNAVHFSYKRYLVNRIREDTGLEKVPLRLLFRLRTGTIDFSKRKGKGEGKKKKGRGKK